jgi:antitoxin VapB
LARVRRPSNSAARAAEIEALVRRGRARQLLDARSAEEIIGYDEHGLPV